MKRLGKDGHERAVISCENEKVNSFDVTDENGRLLSRINITLLSNGKTIVDVISGVENLNQALSFSTFNNGAPDKCGKVWRASNGAALLSATIISE